MAGRRQELSTLKRHLEGCDPKNRESFRQMIEEAVTLFDDQQAMAEFFSVTPPTVSRWKSGKNAPLIAMRKLVQSMLLERVEKALAEETSVRVRVSA